MTSRARSFSSFPSLLSLASLADASWPVHPRPAEKAEVVANCDLEARPPCTLLVTNRERETANRKPGYFSFPFPRSLLAIRDSPRALSHA
jgi:hypothetical protein